MRYLIEPRDRIYVKGHGFLLFAKNIGKHEMKQNEIEIPKERYISPEKKQQIID